MIALPRLAGRIFGVPLAIEPGKLDVIVAAVAPRLFGIGTLAVWDGDDEPASRSSYVTTPDGIAIIDIQGTLVYKSTGMDSMSGLTSYGQIASEFSAALSNPSVRGILLNIDSPGGEARGAFDLADAMLQARGQKPVCAFAGSAFSAAYMLASTADQIVVPRDAGVGSVGVMMLHLDESGADQKAGLKYTAIFAGDRKNDGSPHEPLSDTAHARMKGIVDALNGMFVASVAKGRGMSADAVLKTQALTYMGQDGVDVGFADRVGTPGDALALLRSTVQSGKRTISAARAATGVTHMTEVTIDPLAAPAAAAQPPVAAALPAPAVDTEAIRAAGRNEATAEISLIIDMCAIAGKPQMAAQFISDKTSAADVRKQLLAAKVTENGPELNSSVMPGADAANAGKGAAPQGKAKPWKEVIAALCGRKETK